MNVCIVGPANSVHTQRWVAALRDSHVSVSLLSPGPLPVPLPSTLAHVPIWTFEVGRAGMRRWERVVTLLGGWGRVPGLLRALRPDIVHIHSLPTPAAVPFLLSTPNLVVSAWGSDVVQRDRRKARLYPYLLAKANQLTATSRYLADVVATYLRAPRTIRVIPFGIEPAHFTPAVSAPSQLHIGSLRHLEAKYGLDVLLDALPLILKTHPRQHVHIAGAGPQRAVLEARARDLGILEHLTFWGSLPHAAVPDFLRSLGLFVMPSRAEAFGVAALEAQACGLPVVASHVGGLPEVVRHGETGLLVPPEQPAALAAALVELLDDPSRRASMGREGRHWVLERYVWQDNVEEMLAVYDRVRSGA